MPPLGDMPVPLSGGEQRSYKAAQFTGNTVFPSSDLAGIVQSYLNRPLGSGELEELRQKLTYHYVSRGYVNSGAILAVPVDDTLRFTIVEGRIAQVRISGLHRLHEDYVISRLLPDPQAPFNADQLRQRFETLLNDPLFARANARIIPGDRLGAAILELDFERAAPYSVSVFANNYRSPSIGSNAVGVSGVLRNITGRGDAATLGWQTSPNVSASDRTSFGWSVPIGMASSVYVQLDQGRSSVVEAPLTALDIKSDLENAELGISHQVFDRMNHRFSLGVSASQRRNTSTLLGAPFSFSAGVPNGFLKADTVKFSQDYGFRSQNQVLALRSSLARTHDNLNPSPLGDRDPDQAPATYTFWLGQAYYARRITDAGTQVIARGTVQHAQARVIALDALSVGGANTVRGYRENQLLRDKGQVVNLEVSSPMYGRPGADRFNVVLVPFIDWGRAQNVSQPSTTLSSAGLATRIGWRGLRAEFAYAKRLQRPESVDALHGNLQDHGVHFQVSYAVF